MLDNNNNFNHFKVHTQYSICEGAIKIDELADYILQKKPFSSSLVSSKVINLLLDTIKNVYKYKGNTDISDIVFFEKN